METVSGDFLSPRRNVLQRELPRTDGSRMGPTAQGTMAVTAVVCNGGIERDRIPVVIAERRPSGL